MTENKFIGQCIYCKFLPTPEDGLSDEHIFPFGLYGRSKLLKASCLKCAEKTSTFESKVMRHDLGHIRAALKFPSRRKSNGRRFTVDVTSYGGKVESILVKPEEFYPPLALPIFDPPAYVSKQKYTKSIRLIGYAGVKGGGNSNVELARKLNAKEIGIYSLRWPDAWAQMFAKIAYAGVVNRYGLDQIEETFVIDAILGKTDDIGMWVGCPSEPVIKGPMANGQAVWSGIQDGLIMAHVKLFGWAEDFPEYQVIVGRAKNSADK